MANMSYCRFENTSNDVLDCLEELNRHETLQQVEEDTNHRDFSHLEELIENCRELVERYEDLS